MHFPFPILLIDIGYFWESSSLQQTTTQKKKNVKLIFVKVTGKYPGYVYEKDKH